MKYSPSSINNTETQKTDMYVGYWDNVFLWIVEFLYCHFNIMVDHLHFNEIVNINYKLKQ